MPELTSLLALKLTLFLNSNYSELFVYPARSLPFRPQPFYSTSEKTTGSSRSHRK